MIAEPVPALMQDAQASQSVDEQRFAEEAADAIVAEARRRGHRLEIQVHNKRYSEMGLLVFPTVSDESSGWSQGIELSIELEDWWNEQQPRPHRRVRLTPAWNPEISLRSTPEPAGTV